MVFKPLYKSWQKTSEQRADLFLLEIEREATSLEGRHNLVVACWALVSQFMFLRVTR